MSEDTPEVAKPPRDVKFQQSQLQESGIARNRWGLCLAYEQEFDDLMNPQSWSHIANRIRVSDIIDVTTIDQRFYAELYVLDCSRVHVNVGVMRHMPLSEMQGSDNISLEYKPVWKGPGWRWCVIRQTDGAVMTKNLPHKAAAANWIKMNEHAAGAA